MEIGYRSDNCIGGSEMRAAHVMAFETYELGNSDILLTLANGVLKDSDIALELMKRAESTNEVANNESFVDWVAFYNVVLLEIKRVTGVSVSFVLWLTDRKEDALSYGTNIQQYYKGEVLLSDLGREGKLWGYQFQPLPLDFS